MFFSHYFWDCFLTVFTFYFCKLTGILPSHVGGKWFTVQTVLQKAGGFEENWECLRLSYFSGFIFIILNSALLALWYNYSQDLPGNKLMAYYTITNSFPSYLLVLLACSVRRKATVQCLYSACLKYSMSSPSTKSSCSIVSSIFLHFFVVLLVCSLYVYLFDDRFLRLCFTALVELSYLPTFATSLLISLLCLVAERAYITINIQLRDLSMLEPRQAGGEGAGKLGAQLEILMFQHEVVTDFVDEINFCFNYDLVVLLIDFTYQLIFFSYSLTFFSDGGIQLFLIRLLLIAVRLVKFLVVCNCSQQVHKQVNLLSVNLHSVKHHFLDIMDPKIELLMSDFAGAVSARPVILNAAGFTTIDFTLLFKLTGTAVIYACAAYQYNTTAKIKS